MTSSDPFDEGIPRDGRGRPLIIPITRGKPKPDGKLAAYTRASTFAKALDDGSGLTTWKVRHAVLGVAVSPDLAGMAAALGRNLNNLSPSDKRDLDVIADRAHDRSGGNEKADYGTAVHALTEPDRDPFALTDELTGDVAAYNALIAGMGVEVVDTERFIVNDDLKVAGTFDHTYRLTRDLVATLNGVEVTIPAGTIVVGDKKTGTLHFGQHAIQLAVYARGRKYDHVTGERESMDASPQYGLVVHIPKGKGAATAYLVDLAAGWKGAKLAGEVRAYRSTQNKLATVVAEVKPDPVEPAPAIEPAPVAVVVDDVAEQPAAIEAPRPEPVTAVSEPARPAPADDMTRAVELVTSELDAVDAIVAQIRVAESPDTCRALWSTHRQAWTDEHTAAVKARLAQLAEPQQAAA